MPTLAHTTSPSSSPNSLFILHHSWYSHGLTFCVTRFGFYNCLVCGNLPLPITFVSKQTFLVGVVPMNSCWWNHLPCREPERHAHRARLPVSIHLHTLQYVILFDFCCLEDSWCHTSPLPTSLSLSLFGWTFARSFALPCHHLLLLPK